MNGRNKENYQENDGCNLAWCVIIERKVAANHGDDILFDVYRLCADDSRTRVKNRQGS